MTLGFLKKSLRSLSPKGTLGKPIAKVGGAATHLVKPALLATPAGYVLIAAETNAARRKAKRQAREFEKTRHGFERDIEETERRLQTLKSVDPRAKYLGHRTPAHTHVNPLHDEISAICPGGGCPEALPRPDPDFEMEIKPAGMEAGGGAGGGSQAAEADTLKSPEAARAGFGILGFVLVAGLIWWAWKQKGG